MKLKKLKLNKISESELQNREMNRLLGGSRCCTCACRYEHDGGSSTLDNGNANHRGGSGGLNSYCYDAGGFIGGYLVGTFG